MTTLGEICAESGGTIQTGPFGSQLHASDYVSEGTPVVMPKDIGDNRINSDDAARVTAEDAARLGRHRLKAGDIVYSRRGDVERRALVRDENEGSLCGTGCLLVRIADQEVHDSSFISYALGQEVTRRWIVRHAVGATMLNLNTQILSSVPLRVPEVWEQRAIAEVLGALDDKIAANERLVKTADDLAGALTRQSLSGQRAPLTDLASVVMGSSPPGTSYNEDGVGVAFYQGVRDFGVRYPSNRVWTTEPVRLAAANDTLLSVRAPVGRTNLASERTCIGRGLAALRSLHCRPMTLFHTLREDPDVWAPYEAEGTVFGSINKKQLASLQISTVKPEVELTLEQELVVLEARVASALRETDALASTRDTLLPLLLSGKVRVEDVKKQIEEVV